MFQFNYTITDDDYLNFNLNHMLHSKIGKKTGLIVKLTLPCLCVFVLIVHLLLNRDFTLLVIELIMFTIANILWIVLYKKSILRSIKRNVRMMKKSGRLPYSENGTLIFDEDFIYDNGTLQGSKTSYNLIEAIYTTNEALYIYNSAASAIILPYRFIENQAVFNNLVNFLQTKTNKTIINITN